MKCRNSLFVLILILISCKDKPTGSQNLGEIFPLTIGNNWKWEWNNLDTNQKWEFESTIIDTVEKLGNVWYTSTIDIFNETALRHDYDGLWAYYEDSTTGNKAEILFAKYPVNVGERFGKFYHENGTFQQVFTCVEKNRIYYSYDNCVVYQANEPFYKQHNYVRFYYIYSPDIGLVGTEAFVNDSLKSFTLLNDYNIL